MERNILSVLFFLKITCTWHKWNCRKQTKPWNHNVHVIPCPYSCIIRHHFVYAPSQCEPLLQCISITMIPELWCFFWEFIIWRVSEICHWNIVHKIVSYVLNCVMRTICTFPGRIVSRLWEIHLVYQRLVNSVFRFVEYTIHWPV